MPRVYQTTAGMVITKAREMIGDSSAGTGYRTADITMIGHLNDAINVLLNLKPGLFTKNTTHVCDAGYIQQIVADRAVGFIEVVGVPMGDRAALTAFNPTWISATQAATANWMNVSGEPLRFDVYPPALAASTLTIRYVASPTPIAVLADLVPVSENYEPLLVEYVAGRNELKDDEHVNSLRASQLMDRFIAQVKGIA